MKGRKRRYTVLFLTALFAGFFTFVRPVSGAGNEGEEGVDLWEAEEAVLAELDLDEVERGMEEIFPEEKISFREVTDALIRGDAGEILDLALGFVRDRLFYEFNYNRESLVHILLIALAAAVFTNFAGAFRSRQISEISFYLLYMLLITLCLTSFRMAMDGAEEKLEALNEFMRLLCPSYFMAVAMAAGSTTSLFFYNVILFLAYVVETVIIRFLLPVINLYIMIKVLGNLTGEDFLSELADLMQKMVSWILKTLLACIIGINVVQGLLAPAIDSLQRSAVTKTVQALPGVGNLMGGVTDVMLGSAVLIKNGIGMAGALIAAGVCVVPILQMAASAFLYKLAAALVQPVSDKRITGCISGISEGYELLVKVLFSSALLFLLTIAVVAVSTS